MNFLQKWTLNVHGMMLTQKEVGQRADIHLHCVHPFLIWDFFYLVIQLTQMQHILRNLEGAVDVMLRREQVELTSVCCSGSAAD